MSDDDIITLFNKGFSMQYILSEYFRKVNKNVKKWNVEKHYYEFSKNYKSKEDCSRYVYNLIFQYIQDRKENL